ncbi:DNA polymerase III subunit gamma/tau [Erythrobacteraceae bacterium CFH 75059]|uniref:DNA polymerase III subunit gamma/tau n=1 Tax=Qipengyuania thermophila TaxID=2509361 RepID=UPI00101ECD96|nr:DNA polymerase III subunit gamma/tau [Qipengyuania thermophila]TCD05004.1 DNA polymerase III subunit gamma/tau [Erythrobacteraceae bacterium CFH 75059]
MIDSPPSPAADDTLPWSASVGPAEGGGQTGDQPAMFDDLAAPAPGRTGEESTGEAGTGASPYRVLARKYRPQTFAALIGQDAMVRTLGNAIRRNRLAHAFLMTGVRGVGKTTTARLIAKALNCIGPDGQGGPTIDPCGRCEPCTAIAAGRHIDVIEMDAASHTGIDDVREIIEAVRYAAVSARYKMYIIDEAHMLSKQAWNGLLKTLEEPPAHVKFLFATTEVDKVPVTVLSRTQRFDLRRIPAAMLADHYASVCASEGVEAEREALDLIAAAAEGSVRDGLSMLDQAIAHVDADESASVTAAQVRAMLGLADRAAVWRIVDAIIGGDQARLLREIDEQYALGVEPAAILRAMLEAVHALTVEQIGGTGKDAGALVYAPPPGMAGRLAAGRLHRLWQLVLKGYEEVRSAPDGFIAARMALLRVLYAADLPDPGELARRMHAPPSARSDEPRTEQPEPAEQTSASLSWSSLVEQVENAGEMHAASVMRLQVRVVWLEPRLLVFSRGDEFRDPIDRLLRDALFRATGERWQVTEERGAVASEPSLAEAQALTREHERRALLEDPVVRTAFALFPGAQLVEDRAVASEMDEKRSVTA